MIRRAFCILFFSLIVAYCSSAAPLKTVMADYSGVIRWPISMILPGAFSAHSISTTNLYVNGLLFIPTTNGMLVISGISSNQIGSLTSPIDVSNDPKPNESLLFNGVTAEWVSASNMIFNGDSAFGSITLDGHRITKWSDITNQATIITGDIIANSVEAPIIQGTVGSFSNLLAPIISAEEMVLNGISITNWSDVTNGMVISGSDIYANSVTSKIIAADAVVVGGIMITNWSSITGSSDWARSAASTNINAGGHDITNLSGISLSGDRISSWGQLTNKDNWATVSAATNINVGGYSLTNLTGISLSGVSVTNWSQLTNTENWSVTAAGNDIDAGGNSITNLGGISLNNEQVTSWGQLTNGTVYSGEDAILGSLTAASILSTNINVTNLTAASIDVGAITFNGISITNINQGASNYIPYSYSSFSVMDSTDQVSAVQLDSRYGKAKIQFRNSVGAGQIEWASNRFYFSSASSNDIIVNSGVIATGTPIYAESDPLWEAARQSAAEILVVNASNILAGAVSAEEFILNGAGVTNWSQLTNTENWSVTAAGNDIDAGGNSITNLGGIELSGETITSWENVSIYSTNFNLVTNTVFTDNADVNGFSLTNVGTIYFNGGGSISSTAGVFEFGE